MNVLAISGLSYGFRGPQGEVSVLHGLDLAVAPEEIVIVTGPSGSGKSTLLSLAGLLRRPPPGTVHLFGVDVGTAGEAALGALRGRMRFVFQKSYLVAGLTVLENVIASLVALPETNRRFDDIRARRMLENVGLADKVGAYPHQLSGGQQQRVAVARALVALPELLIVDEPTAALDREAARIVVDQIRLLTQTMGCGVLMTTHDDRIMDVATRRLHLADGRLSQPPGEWHAPC
ncbi:putative ABC transport system ATP-binding protein [Stella humosa]|uniref:Putative ABC transport system ATP-binding protein n=1 Tax=Stella humosa TaxID=94 RepID=A0A3N1M9X2_9PROT|nr:ABC transporter ATP-binding protein [Stella humosa]ROQ00029.1 putative ABC transport system ATP-binding protein [Stella humosa]BBK30739.1 ABC transporter [Stella humosa]